MVSRYLSLSLVFLAYIVLIFAAPDTAQEDALITARHARNLIEFGALTFNQGENVLGTTTPLWALILSISFFVPLPDPSYVKVMQLASAVFALASVELGTRFQSKSWVLPLIVGLCPPVIHMAKAGMETALLCYLGLQLIKALWLELQGDHVPRWLPVAINSLMLSTRLDSCLLIASTYAVSASFSLSNNLRLGLFRRWLTDAFFTFCFLAAFLGSIFYFYGLAIPHTIVAKARGHVVVDFLPFVIKVLSDINFLTGFNWPWPRILWPLDSLVPIFLLGSLVIATKTKGSFYSHVGRIAGLYIVVYALFLTSGGASAFPWYSNVPGFLLALSIVGSSLIERYKSITTSLAGIVVFTLFLTFRHAFSNELSSNRVVGEVLLKKGAPYLATEPIGYVGYYCHCKILDLAGLVSPDVVPIRRHGKPGWFSDVIMEKKPQYVLLRKGEVNANLGWNIGTLFSSQDDLHLFHEIYALDTTVSPSQYGESFELYRYKR